MECLSCGFFNQLDTVKTDFIVSVFNLLGPALKKDLLPPALVLYFLIQGIMMIIKPGNAWERVEAFIPKILVVTVVYVALSAAPDGRTPIIYDWVIAPIENLGLNVGMAIVAGLPLDAPSGVDAASMSGYAQLAARVEGQALRVLDLCANMITKQGSMGGVLSGGFFASIIAALMLTIPYAFVMAIFVAFMLEAMFKTVAIGIVSPLLLFALAFKPTRAFTLAGVRILLGAALTIILASGAMGFSMTVTQHSIDSIMGDTRDTLLAEYRTKCVDGFIDPADGQRQIWCNLMSKKIEDGDELVQPIDIFDLSYWTLFVIGFASILLHLQAKALASNLSGANDGPGPAAATVAAAKATMAGGAYYASRTMSGAGGLGASLKGAMQGQSGITTGGIKGVGQALYQHGAMGAAPAMLAHMLSNGTRPSESGAGETKYAGGVGGPMQLDNKTIQQLGQSIGKSVADAIQGGAGGQGRDREGNMH